jgi:hypothetical protein
MIELHSSKRLSGAIWILSKMGDCQDDSNAG